MKKKCKAIFVLVFTCKLFGDCPYPTYNGHCPSQAIHNAAKSSTTGNKTQARNRYNQILDWCIFTAGVKDAKEASSCIYEVITKPFFGWGPVGRRGDGILDCAQVFDDCEACNGDHQSTAYQYCQNVVPTSASVTRYINGINNLNRSIPQYFLWFFQNNNWKNYPGVPADRRGSPDTAGGLNQIFQNALNHFIGNASDLQKGYFLKAVFSAITSKSDYIKPIISAGISKGHPGKNATGFLSILNCMALASEFEGCFNNLGIGGSHNVMKALFATIDPNWNNKEFLIGVAYNLPKGFWDLLPANYRPRYPLYSIGKPGFVSDI